MDEEEIRRRLEALEVRAEAHSQAIATLLAMSRNLEEFAWLMQRAADAWADRSAHVQAELLSWVDLARQVPREKFTIIDGGRPPESDKP